jgi:large subunit ribosomal protein L4
VAVLKKYDLTGKVVGELSVDDMLLEAAANTQMIKDYIVALRANARQWSANTKTRAEVCHSGKKPHAQKGTGRARQGYLGAPQYKGGGRVHAPRPKFDQHVGINKKEKRAAIRHLLVEKILGNSVHVLADPSLKEGKTRYMAAFLKACQLEGKKVLFLGAAGQKNEKADEESKTLLLRSMQNIPTLQFKQAQQINGYDVLVSQDLVIMDSAMDQLMQLLKGQE